jgi:hypothetical protein
MTTGQILGYFTLHILPPKVFPKVSVHFGTSWVNGELIEMGLIYNVLL